jgi:ketosteroid isomerase-like protein
MKGPGIPEVLRRSMIAASDLLIYRFDAMPSVESEVLAANQAFYDAFARGDLTGVDALWARRAPVACIHPGWDALHGRDEVMASWRSILHGSGPPVRCVRPIASVLGECAFVVCGENIQGAELVATNVFVREDGVWKLVHHHAGPVQRRVEVRRPSGMLN